jgi:Flp pilus assembly protein TadD
MHEARGTAALRVVAAACMASWFQRLFGAKPPEGPRWFVIRDRDAARQFPVQTPFDRRGLTRESGKKCECGGLQVEVVITTGGPMGDPELWAEHPLALDGWSCPGCNHLSGPRVLEPDEVTALTQQGSAAAQERRFDEAELAFRRVANSWPQYGPGRFNLAALYEERLMAELAGERRVRVESRLRNTAEHHAQEALRGSCVPVHLPVGVLVRLYLHSEAEEKARDVVGEASVRDGLSAAETEGLAHWGEYVRRRQDLFDRGHELVKEHILLHDRPESKLYDAARERIKEGVDLLLRHASVRPESAAALFLAGKGLQVLGDEGGCVRELARASAVDPAQHDIAREYCLALLATGRPNEAVAVARQACASKPQDAGLVANLGIAILLAGDLAAAEREVERACRMDGRDPINRALSGRLRQIRSGERPMPRSLQELNRA